MKGCFPISATYDLDFPDPAPGSAEENILENLFRQREDAREASPLRHVGGNRIPFYLVFGARDFERVARSGREMASALAEQPGEVEWTEFEGLDHFQMSLQAGEAQSPWVAAVRRRMAGV